MNKKDLLLISLITISIICFFLAAGTLTSGYQLIDDHEILRIKDDLSTQSFLEVSFKWIKRDLSIRYRPMYFVHRLLEVKAFGNNLIAWSVYTAFLFSSAMILFYAGMRKMGFPIPEALLFILLTFIGPQMTIWWRLGPNETIGMFFLGLAFYFMVNCQKRYFLNTLLFSFFLICASLSKESFTIIIPGMLIFKIWYEKKLFRLKIIDALKKNYILSVPFLVMLFNFYIIIFIVGTNKIGYAGVSGSVVNLIRGSINILSYSLKNYILLSVTFLMIASIGIGKKNIIEFYKKITFPFLFLILIVTPNLILYAKSGMQVGRYTVPAVFGFSIFIFSLIKETGKAKNNLRVVFLLIVLGFIISLSPQVFKSAKSYATRGTENNTFLSTIVDNSTEASKLLLVVDPVQHFEASLSVKSYIYIDNNIPLYGYAVYNRNTWDGNENLVDTWDDWFDGKTFYDLIDSPDIIIFLDQSLINRFFDESEVDKESYTNLFQASEFVVLKVK